MAKLTNEEVLHVAKLAGIELTASEVEKFSKQLSNVISQIGELSEVDTSNTEPTSQTTGLENVFRGDKVDGARVLTSDQATGGSDKIYNGYFKVGAILSERSDK